MECSYLRYAGLPLRSLLLSVKKRWLSKDVRLEAIPHKLFSRGKRLPRCLHCSFRFSQTHMKGNLDFDIIPLLWNAHLIRGQLFREPPLLLSHPLSPVSSFFLTANMTVASGDERLLKESVLLKRFGWTNRYDRFTNTNEWNRSQALTNIYAPE